MRVSAAVVVSGALLLAGCTSTGSAGGGTTRPPASTSKTGRLTAPVTGQQMAAIVAATATENNRANQSLSLSELKSYEAGSALAIDGAAYAESAQLTNSECSFLPFGVKVLQAMAKGGTSYPAQFVVLGNTYQMKPPHGCRTSTAGCPDAGTILVFSRSTASSPWQIVLEPNADPGDTIRLRGSGANGSGSIAAGMPPAGPDPKVVPTDVANALEGYETSGHLGSLKATYFTGSCWPIPDPRAAYEQYRKSDVNEAESYSPASDLVSYVTASGRSALAIFTLHFEIQLVPAEASSSIAWASDPESDPVTALLPTGAYSRIVENGSLQIAAVVGSGANGTDFTIIGSYGGVTSISGTKGSTSSSGGGGILVSYGG